MKRIHFFAPPVDIVPVLARFEANAPLKFVETGNLTTPDRTIFLRSEEIPEPGISTHETGGISRTYLVSLRETKHNARAFVGLAGERRWTLDNGDNDGTVILTMAGF